MTAKLCCALPPAFVAVTVTVALPSATALMVTLAPSTATVATVVSGECAAYVSPSPSKWPEAVMVRALPTASVTASMAPTAAGADGVTVTVKLCPALPPAFVAVTVTVASPAATAVTVTLAPSTATVATAVSDDSAVYVTPSPSKRSEASSVWVAASVILTAAMLPTVTGAETIAETVTLKRLRSRPLSFRPVTVTVVEPAASGSMVISVPDRDVRTMPLGDAATS